MNATLSLPQYQRPELVAEAQRITSEIDPTLTIMACYYLGTDSGIYHVSKDNRDLVLKWTRFSTLAEKEAKALMLCRGMEQVPEFVRLYYEGNINALLKTHISGETLSEMSCRIQPVIRDGYFLRPWKRYQFRRSLDRIFTSGEKLITAIHQRGISRLDPHWGNILHENDRAGFFDFDIAIFRDENESEFERGKEIDLNRFKIAIHTLEEMLQ